MIKIKVVPIASTMLHTGAVEMATPYEQHKETYVVAPIDELAEFAGRNCYQSWNRPNSKTASNEGYLTNIIAQQHYSVMEHGSVTFYVTGVSRALLAELTRHRHLSFSVVSQRYVDANDLSFNEPPILEELEGDVKAHAESVIRGNFENSLDDYNDLVNTFMSQGFKRKEAREAARAVLPNMMDTPLVVTGNIRAWRDVLGKRYHIAADREIQGFATEVLKHLRVLAPNCVSDIGGKYGE